MPSSIVYLCSNCRITNGHHKYFSDATAAENYFKSKAIYTIEGMLTIRQSYSFMTGSKHGYNVNEVHVALPLSSVTNLDYICYKNDTDNIFFINKVVSLEYVNENSSRIIFIIDNYATYIGYITLGYCFIERSHVPNYLDIQDYLLEEPISVPTNMQNVTPNTLNEAWDQIHADTNYVIYMSSDRYGNSNTNTTRIQFICGSPFFGTVYRESNFSSVEEILKDYLNQSGILQSSVLPTVSNICKIIFCPKIVSNESNTGYSLKLEQDILLPKVKFKKCYSPQFVQAKLIALSSGNSFDLDVTKGILSDYSLKLSFTILGSGGTSPQMALAVNLPTQDNSKFIDSRTIVISHITYPEIPICDFVKSDNTLWGQVKSSFSSTMKGAEIGGLLGGYIGPEGMIAGSIAGAGIGFSMSPALYNDNLPYSNYTLSSTPSSTFALSQDFYRYELIICQPTPEGYKILNSFFNTFGYKIDTRQILNLKINNNFTYIKTKGGHTHLSDKAPQSAIDDISAMFDRGITIWNTDIGSVEECN